MSFRCKAVAVALGVLAFPALAANGIDVKRGPDTVLFGNCVPSLVVENKSGQTIDYLQSRPDMDPDRIGYHGISFGATWGPVFLALEPRIKTGILVIGGIVNAERTPDISPVSYAPRVKMPVLMLNGRHDPIFPYETSQVPLFNLLATPPAQKRHSVYPGGHSVLQWFDDMVREHYEWLDTVFGPVSPVGGK